MDQYLARICWNSKDWEFPTGEAKNLEVGSYVATDGFGHEEWLFNFTWLLKGEHYAFLQPINRSFERVKGKTIGIALWAIDPLSRRVHIGRIDKCHVLTSQMALEAYDEHKRRGWIKLMEKDLTNVGGNKSKLTPDSLFNIRFRPEDVVRYDRPYPVAKPNERTARLSRYTLVAAMNAEAATHSSQRTRFGSATIPTPIPYSRPAYPGGTANPHHTALQGELMTLLQARFGKDRVKREVAWVDLMIETDRTTALLEIKPYSSAKQSIREALGQILEYAFWGRRANITRLKLFVVAPAIADEEANKYIDLLQSEFHIPVRYCRFSLGCELPAELKNL